MNLLQNRYRKFFEIKFSYKNFFSRPKNGESRWGVRSDPSRGSTNFRGSRGLGLSLDQLFVTLTIVCNTYNFFTPNYIHNRLLCIFHFLRRFCEILGPSHFQSVIVVPSYFICSIIRLTISKDN